MLINLTFRLNTYWRYRIGCISSLPADDDKQCNSCNMKNFNNGVRAIVKGENVTVLIDMQTEWG